MTDFSYLLAVLTHGGNDGMLARTLGSFNEHVSPAPADGYLLADGCGLPEIDWPFSLYSTYEQEGFCAATRALWKRASVADDVTHVFWLEHDFLLTRDVDLADLARVLDTYQGREVAVPEHLPGNPTSTGITGFKRVGGLAQMALMRNAVNEEERAAGGLFESRLGQYWPRGAFCDCGGEVTYVITQREGQETRAWECTTLGGCDKPPAPPPTWLEHRSYLTTNPSLMRRDFMETHPWPAYESECEGKFGLDLLAAGFSFGVWGAGEPWCQHVGERTGHGY